MSTNEFFANVGELSQVVLAPVFNALEPIAGLHAWGWSVLVVGALWRVLTWPWLVSSARWRIERQKQAADSNLEPVQKPRGLFSAIGSGLTLLQVLLIVVIALWSRTGPAAEEASFYGLSPLAASPVFLGFSGVAWALVLTLCGTGAALLGLRATGTTDDRQRFFARYITPVIFVSLGLFLPAAMVLPFIAAMTLNVLATSWVIRRAPVRVVVAA